MLLCQTTAAQPEEETFLREAAERSPAVAALLDMPLEKPADRLSAVFTLLDLGEIDVARTLLAPVLQAELDDQGRAELVERFGTARFLSLARRDRPAGEGETAPLAGARQFARRCIQAAAQQARDPERVAQLVAQLNDPSAEVRNAARVDLAVTGTAGAQACLEALAREADETRRANLMLALTKLRPEVDPLLLAVLADGEGHLLRDAAELAGHTGMLSAAPLLAAVGVKPENDQETIATAQTALAKLGLSHADLAEARERLHLLVADFRFLHPSDRSRALAAFITPALVLGALFPLLAGVLAEDESASTARGDVYFVNMIGSAAGAFAAGFLLIPNWGLRGTLGAAVALNLAPRKIITHQVTLLTINAPPASRTLIPCIQTAAIPRHNVNTASPH
ncbi:MAG: hypothetical protein IH831_01990 [Planctomycetes bacterium]|nr:hypothetical protein [Planctomycetota bacterium]